MAWSLSRSLMVPTEPLLSPRLRIYFRYHTYEELFMPRKKLTLSVDEEAVRRARWFTKKHDTSISRLVSEFLLSLGDSEVPDTPIVSRLVGILPSDTRLEDYHEHLVEKHGS
jgi:hypothetical protein